MPPSVLPRRSSIPGVRRGPQKAHIPYHADDLGRGKKTGYSIEPVEHPSDEFEDFAKVLKQADARTPPRVKSKIKKAAGKSGGRSGKKKTPARHVVQSDEEEEDGGGEQDMSIDVPGLLWSLCLLLSIIIIGNALHGLASPMEYFRNARPRASQSRPSIVPRLSGRGSEVDFDQIPSPRPSHSGRRSLAGPSYLSHGSAYAENDESLDLSYFRGKDEVISRRSSGPSAWEPPEPDADIDMNQDMDLPMDDDQPLQDDDQEELPQATPSPPPPRTSDKSKSKSRALTPAPEEDEDALMDPPADEPLQEDEPPEEEMEPPPSPPKKKARATKKENKRPAMRETVEPAEDRMFSVTYTQTLMNSFPDQKIIVMKMVYDVVQDIDMPHLHIGEMRRLFMGGLVHLLKLRKSFALNL
jgi:centromere protein C